jgi:hypothetical protein
MTAPCIEGRSPYPRGLPGCDNPLQNHFDTGEKADMYIADTKRPAHGARATDDHIGALE